jgi:hypothetical protein
MESYCMKKQVVMAEERKQLPGCYGKKCPGVTFWQPS